MSKERDIMCWGSCQYDEAAAMFDRCIELELEYGREAVLEKYGQSIGVSLSVEKVYDKLVNAIRKTWEDDEDSYMILSLECAVAHHPEKTIPNCFTICREMAWDLWGASPTIAALVFPSLKIEAIPLTDPKKCGGPTLNQIVQRQNDPTGFCCWLLKSYGYAEEEDFMEFDT